MTKFKRGDWFQFKPEFEPEYVEVGEKFRINEVSAEATYVFYLDPDFTDWQVTEVGRIVKVDDPNPRLTATLNRTPPFAKPEDVQVLLNEAEDIINPSAENEYDWERLHSMQEDLFEKSFAVMLKHKDYREEILKKMLEVVAQDILRW